MEVRYNVYLVLKNGRYEFDSGCPMSRRYKIREWKEASIRDRARLQKQLEAI